MPIINVLRTTTQITDNGDNVADAGEVLRTILTFTNNGTAATSVLIDDLLGGSTENGNINVSPIAFDNAYTAIGNTLLEVDLTPDAAGIHTTFSGNVLTNDVEYYGDTFTISALQATSVVGASVTALSAGGGTVVMDTSGADAGSFTYVSAPGFTGADTFTYTITDDGIDNNPLTLGDNLSTTATVTITVADTVWYVSAGGSGNGTSTNPFGTLTSVQAVDSADDYVYVQGSVTGTLALEANEHVIGTGAALVVGGETLAANTGTNSTATGAAGFTVTLGTGNQLAGINIGGVGGITGTGFGTVTVDDVNINTSGQALSLTTGAFAGTGFDNTTSAGGANNVNLNAVTGTVNLGTGALSGATGIAFDVNGGNGSIDYNGTISHSANTRAIEVTNKTGGTVDFDGSVTSNGSSDGIFLDSNTGATINFDGGLTINMTGATGFNATGGGTVNVTGGSNTINSGNGTAINVANTTIGSGDLNFVSVSANGGVNGIVLNNTGALGGLTVTGTGSAGSGGTIQNTTGPGILLTTTRDIVLDRMIVQNGGDDGIRGTSVTNFTLNNSSVLNNGNAVGERGIDMLDLMGSGGMNATTVSGSAEGHVRIENNNATLTAFNVVGSTFSLTNFTTGDDAMLVLLTGSGSMTASVTGSTFTDNKGDHFQAATDADATGPMNITFNNNILSTTAGNDPNVIGGGVTINTSGSTDIVFSINNNNIQQAFDDAININLDPGSLAGASMNGTINGNTIGTSGVAGSGSESSHVVTVAAKGQGVVDIDIMNNSLFEWGNEYGILLQTSEGSADIFAKVTGNTLHVQTFTILHIDGIHLNAGATAGDNGYVELVITGNDVTGEGNAGAGAEDIRLRQRFLTTVELPGYVGANTDTAAVNAFVAANNDPAGATPAPTVSSAQNVGGGGGGFIGGTAVPLLAATPPPAPDAPTGEPGADDGGETGGEIVTPTPAPTPAPGGTGQPAIVDDGILGQAELDVIVEAAIQRWAAAGATAEQLAAMRAATVTVESMTGLWLGSSEAGRIVVDDNAAGFDWFVDATPGDDAEYSGQGSQLSAIPGTVAAARVDLLTTIMHELGHQIGLDDDYSAGGRDELMYGTINPGERRLPGADDAHGASGTPVEGIAFALTQISLGTIPAGRDVTVVFDSVVDTFVSEIIDTFTNFSTVSGSNPGAFSVNSNSETLGPGVSADIVLDSLELGGTIWNDNGAGGGIKGNGLLDGGELGVSGVTLALFADAANDGTPDTALPIATATSDLNGDYSFTGLAPGHYIVRVDETNFDAGFPLDTRFTTVGEPDPDGTPDIDNDDNGRAPAAPGDAVFSHTITIAHNAETVDDGTGQLDINDRLDFGFITPNQAPTSTNLSGDTAVWTEGDGNVLLDTGTGVLLGDDDADFNGGMLTVALGGATVGAEDQLVITNNGGVTFDATTVSVGGNQIATYTGGGAGGGALVFTFTSALATTATVATLIQAIAYTNTGGDTPTDGDRTITWTLKDGDGTANFGQDTLVIGSTVDVDPVNDLPSVTTTAGNTSFVEGVNTPSTPVVIDSGLTLADLDDTTFVGGGAAITDNYEAGEDVLSFTPGVAYGDIDVFSNAGGILALASPSGTATLAQWQAALRSITYTNTSEEPVTATREIAFSLLDDDAGLSNAALKYIDLQANNDAPSGTSQTISTLGEDGTHVLMAGDLGFTDLDFDLLQGVIFTSAPTGGTLFYDADGAGGTDPVAIATFPTAMYDLTDLGGKLTFTPDAELSGPGAAQIFFAVVDDGGTTGTGVDTDPSPKTLTFDIAAVNDAPVLADAAVLMAAQSEDDPAPVGAVGTLVSTLVDLDTPVGGLDNVTDPDSGAIGIAVTAANETDGTLYYSTDAGANWFAVGAVTPGSALLLGPADRLYFQPDPGFDGTIADAITFRAWDMSAGSAGTLADTTVNGGASAFSTATDTASLTVTPDNLNPVLGVTDTLSYNEDDPATVIAPATTLTDDSADFDTGTVTASFGLTGTPDDQLAIRNEGNGAAQIGVSGVNITYGPDMIGTFVGGVNGADLVITLAGSAATAAAVEALLRNITFANTSDDPVTVARTVTFTVTDGDGGTSADTATVNVAASDDPSTANDDAFTITEAGAVTGGDLFADNGGAGIDSDPDDPLVITHVNNSTANVGAGGFNLPTGAHLTVLSDGTIDYNPGSIFAALPVPATGASNTPYLETFTYTLTDGTVATVTITITGLDTNDLIMGTAGNDTLIADGGLDDLRGLAGDDNYYINSVDDMVTEGAGDGFDQIHVESSYALIGGYEIEVIATRFNFATDAFNLTGNIYGQVIIGNAGMNTLVGGGGEDDLRGLAGNDTYYVDSTADLVHEAVGGGADRVNAEVTYALLAGQEIEILSTRFHYGTDAIDLIGNGFDQTLIGNGGMNVLVGAGGADDMRGLAGNDIYYVDNAGDLVREVVGAGEDWVRTELSYALMAGQEVEILSTRFNHATDAINLTGNSFGQTIIGNDGTNILFGGGGADDLRGLGGNDTYYVDHAGDIVQEGVGQGFDRVNAEVSHTLISGMEVEILSTRFNFGTDAIDLTGNQIGQIVIGNAGANMIDGKGGSDDLRGLGGADTFAFTSALGAGNVDVIRDYAAADDSIVLDDAVFTGLATGALSPNAFVVGTAATHVDHRIIYNSATGALLFDADGAGAGTAVQFATLQGAPAITASEFTVI